MKEIFAALALLALTGCTTRLPEDGGRQYLTQMEMTRLMSADELDLVCAWNGTESNAGSGRRPPPAALLEAFSSDFLLDSGKWQESFFQPPFG